jgi:phosphatidylinositol kinase/protein kinase (PI-3  family)
MYFVGLNVNSFDRDHLLERSRSFEQFFRIRQSCIRSYAAMCIVHWILGIGDRHLQNSLMSLETGRIIGIDFGRAFEATNNAQSIPEMIPFRLSPNFNHLLMPYGYRGSYYLFQVLAITYSLIIVYILGLFKETMCIAWRCLLLSSESIIFIINTFVNERSMNWAKSRKTTGMITDDPLENPPNWQPLQIIKNKLKCKNPKSILLDVIKSNPQKEIVPVYCDIIRNCQGIGFDENKTLKNNEVIDCILELATDKNILARIYVGLSAWI